MTDWNEASPGVSASEKRKDQDTEADASPGDSTQDESKDRDTDALLERLAESEAQRQRLLDQRAMLVERRRAIMFGKARDDYGREIARIDERLAVMRRAG